MRARMTFSLSLGMVRTSFQDDASLWGAAAKSYHSMKIINTEKILAHGFSLCKIPYSQSSNQFLHYETKNTKSGRSRFFVLPKQLLEVSFGNFKKFAKVHQAPNRMVVISICRDTLPHLDTAHHPPFQQGHGK